jgi:threonylcarbamoyladenosine tRNA methylthiotransferase MtaB
MRTFSIQTLGCKVNQYESDQIATLLRSRGLEQVDSGGDLRVVNSCSVTIQAASKSRQATRRAVRLPVLPWDGVGSGSWVAGREDEAVTSIRPATDDLPPTPRPKVVLTGCWATSHPADAAGIPGVDAVLGHHDDVAAELHRLMDRWTEKSQSPEGQTTAFGSSETTFHAAKPVGDEGSIKAGASPSFSDAHYTQSVPAFVKKNFRQTGQGTRSLPLLNERQNGHQRAMLKIQDGCDAHCTYCIIPQLRPSLWSKPVEDVIEESRRLVEAGHREIVLTGIFLGAFGQSTALRRRQNQSDRHPMSDLISSLCKEVPGLHRLRFSSLEPGDLTDSLIQTMRQHPQVVPHFHLPLQSGSDALLHRMNRQYNRDDFCRMIDRVNTAFDRPAITTDIIVGFPGETDQEFEQTLEVVNQARFIHIHAFSFSPRPGTAAARWMKDFIHGPIVNERINRLNDLATQHSFDFRRRFLGETVEILVEQRVSESDPIHGRCERYFDVTIDGGEKKFSVGAAVPLRITRVTGGQTFGELVA